MDSDISFVKNALSEYGAVSAGVTSLYRLKEYMTPRAFSRLERDAPWAKTVIAAAFSYFAGGEGSIAKYARGKDYHAVLADRLSKVCRELQEKWPEKRFLSYVDASPIPEVWAARLSGCAVMGLNGMAIVNGCGSYVFLGCIVTDADLPEEEDAGLCSLCGECVAACPTGALNFVNGARSFDKNLCLSHISQKKGGLSERETELLKKNRVVWGCDRCLDACPLNAEPHITGIPEFREDLIRTLDLNALKSLDDEAFLALYKDRAFCWRGRKTLIRNLEILESED